MCVVSERPRGRAGRAGGCAGSRGCLPRWARGGYLGPGRLAVWPSGNGTRRRRRRCSMCWREVNGCAAAVAGLVPRRGAGVEARQAALSPLGAPSPRSGLCAESACSVAVRRWAVDGPVEMARRPLSPSGLLSLGPSLSSLVRLLPPSPSQHIRLESKAAMSSF